MNSISHLQTVPFRWLLIFWLGICKPGWMFCFVFFVVGSFLVAARHTGASCDGESSLALHSTSARDELLDMSLDKSQSGVRQNLLHCSRNSFEKKKNVEPVTSSGGVRVCHAAEGFRWCLYFHLKHFSFFF